jgi:hypothetical protein
MVLGGNAGIIGYRIMITAYEGDITLLRWVEYEEPLFEQSVLAFFTPHSSQSP